MRYCLDHDETNCFEKNGFVLLKELFSSDKVQKVLASYQSFFREHKDVLEYQKREARGGMIPSFYARDSALHSQELRRLLFSKAIGHIAGHLSMKKKLRYGGDWLWQGNKMPWSASEEPFSLESCFCVKPIAIACLIALTDGSPQEKPFLPEKAGDALFFSSHLVYPWNDLKENGAGQKFLLMVYAEEDAAYMPNPLDPHTHDLKRVGYVFHDRLKETTHPHIIR